MYAFLLGLGAKCFNPRPPSLAGEPLHFFSSVVAIFVSIHARHRWRANGRVLVGLSHLVCFNPRPPSLAGEPISARFIVVFVEFQSTPAIAGGRTSPRLLS
jgi:hypothetical protein